jgi:hypothetical protein
MENKKKALKCSECGSPAKCFHQDVGGVDYYDEYVLWCDSCGKIERSLVYGGSPMNDNWLTSCTFCGADCFPHPGTPSELWGYSHRYLPLFKFKIFGIEFCIAVRDEKILLETEFIWPYIPSKELDIPLPNKKMPCEEPDVFGELKLEFSLLNLCQKFADIRVEVRYQQYSEHFIKDPPVIVATRNLLVSMVTKDSFSAVWLDKKPDNIRFW